MFFIKEIFKSIQGEGFFSGKSAVFVRFTGCNLWNGLVKDRENALCQFCDTDFLGTNGQNGGYYSLNDLLNKIDKIWNQKKLTNNKFIVLTGGEPMLQVNKKLVESLKKRGYFVSVETNGTIQFDIDFDWVCVSPKQRTKWKVISGDELKVIFPQQAFDLNMLKKLNFKYFFLQPMDNNKKQINIWNTINYCKSHKPWFPSFQLHKSLNIN